MKRLWYHILDLKYLPRTILTGLKNLFNWFPIIWMDRQWDYIFILRILRKKLVLTEKFIRRDGIHVRNLDDARKIKICINLLDRILSDVYFDMAYKRHNAKWGRAELTFKDCEEDWYVESVIRHKNANTEEEKEQQRKDFIRASKHFEYLEKQDYYYLFKMLRKHIRSWWD